MSTQPDTPTSVVVTGAGPGAQPPPGVGGLAGEVPGVEYTTGPLGQGVGAGLVIDGRLVSACLLPVALADGTAVHAHLVAARTRTVGVPLKRLGRPQGRGHQGCSTRNHGPGQPISPTLSGVEVVPGAMTDKEVNAFAAALSEAEGPVLAFCRTGNRSAALWKASQAIV